MSRVGLEPVNLKELKRRLGWVPASDSIEESGGWLHFTLKDEGHDRILRAGWDDVLSLLDHVVDANGELTFRIDVRLVGDWDGPQATTKIRIKKEAIRS